MADKRSSIQKRREVLSLDSEKDVHFNIAVLIATLAILSSAAAALAVLSLVFLSNFRKDVENLWMCCIPYCFTFVTGLALAYRKQMADVGVHIALGLTTLLAGGAGYGLSVTPVYFERHNCTTAANYEGDCNKEVLTTMYFISGAVASGIAVIGVLMSLCACSNAMSRRNKRAKLREMQLHAEEKQKEREALQRKNQPNSTTTHSPPCQNKPKPTSNGNGYVNIHSVQNVNGNIQKPIMTSTINNINEIPTPNGTTVLPPAQPKDTNVNNVQVQTTSSHKPPAPPTPANTEVADAIETTAPSSQQINNNSKLSEDAQKIIEDLNTALENVVENGSVDNEVFEPQSSSLSQAPEPVNHLSVVNVKNRVNNASSDDMECLDNPEEIVGYNHENGGTTTHL